MSSTEDWTCRGHCNKAKPCGNLTKLTDNDDCIKKYSYSNYDDNDDDDE